MKQVIQNYKTGKVSLMEVPVPAVKSNSVIVQNIASLVSIGTERQMIELGQKSLLGKAKARPDLVKRFLDKAKKEGFVKTFNEAMGRLDDPVQLGYSCSGIVIEVGNDVHGFSPGDFVACIGAGFASHAEYVCVPEKLCVKLPKKLNSDEYISFDEAAFGMLGIISMHGIRCANITFGEKVGVIGLGLLGLLVVQILKAYGCYVVATDIDPKKLEQAKKLGADAAVNINEFVEQSNRFSKGTGLDAVVLTVATKSNEPVNQAVDASRFGGRIVLVGVADIHPNRNEMWKKEVELIVSQAGGPGTFDPSYEIRGVDYLPEHVRWTENRNLEEFLNLVANGKVNVNNMLTHRFSIDKAEDVYSNIMNNVGGPYIGVLFDYPKENTIKRTVEIKRQNVKGVDGKINAGFVGAGLFAKALLLPALNKNGSFNLHTLAASSGATSTFVGNKYQFMKCTTETKEIFESKEIDTVFILTPHSAHASMVIESMKNGKNIFIEKPICINEEELNSIIETYNSVGLNKVLFVGYNRRFSPLAQKMKEFYKNRKDPLIMAYRVNPGFIKGDHWVHAPEQGGSRVIGEMCHFIDMMQAISGSVVQRVSAERISGNNKTALNSDNIVASIKFEDGSVGSLIYSASGDKAFSRERFEVFGDGKVAVLDDYRTLSLHNNGKNKQIKLSNMDMGYNDEIKNIAETINGRAAALITPKEIFNSTLAVIKINESLENGKFITLA